MLHLLRLNNMSEALVNDIPALGFIIESDYGFVITAGYIRTVEGHYGILDSYITNPEVPGNIRNMALDLLTGALIELAKSYELKLIAFSEHKSIHERALRHGFKELPMFFSVLNCSKPD